MTLKYNKMKIEAVSDLTIRKSDFLTDVEVSSLKKFVDEKKVIVKAAEIIGIHRNVLDRVLLTGSGSPLTVAKIRTAIRR